MLEQVDEIETVSVTFEAGEGRIIDEGVNFMMTEDGTVYAECKVPEGAKEDYGYMALKAAVQKAHGGVFGVLEFPYDGQEEHLSEDAHADCGVEVEAAPIGIDAQIWNDDDHSWDDTGFWWRDITPEDTATATDWTWDVIDDLVCQEADPSMHEYMLDQSNWRLIISRGTKDKVIRYE